MKLKPEDLDKISQRMKVRPYCGKVQEGRRSPSIWERAELLQVHGTL